MEITITLKSTTDYDLFRHHEKNRNVGSGDTLQVDRKILRNMEENGFRVAMHIKCYRDDDGKLVIFDGHRRFEHAKLLEIAVVYAEYRVEDAVDPLEYSSGQKTWSLKDKSLAYAHALHDYQEVNDFHQRTGIPHALCYSMFWGDSASSNNASKFVEAGKFYIKERVHPIVVARVCETLKPLCEFATDARLVSVISKSMFADGFDVNHLIKQVIRKPELLKKCRTEADYIDLLELIYNYQGKGVRLYLKVEIEKAMRRRSAVHHTDQ